MSLSALQIYYLKNHAVIPVPPPPHLFHLSPTFSICPSPLPFPFPLPLPYTSLATAFLPQI